MGEFGLPDLIECEEAVEFIWEVSSGKNPGLPCFGLPCFGLPCFGLAEGLCVGEPKLASFGRRRRFSLAESSFFAGVAAAGAPGGLYRALKRCKMSSSLGYPSLLVASDCL